jgi:hypothetical protein
MPASMLLGKGSKLRSRMPITIAVSTAEIGLDLPVGSIPCRLSTHAPSLFVSGMATSIIATESRKPGSIFTTPPQFAAPNSAFNNQFGLLYLRLYCEFVCVAIAVYLLSPA